jgi:hypothetical protein
MSIGDTINIYLPKNNAIFITIISVFIAFASLLYLKPDAFVFAFHTILGNLLIACGLIVVWFLDKSLSISLGLLLLVIYLSSMLGSGSKSGSDSGSDSVSVSGVETFTMNNKKWPQQTIDDFKAFQESRNPNVQYDIVILQKQATVDEVNKLFETGKWPWSNYVQQMYLRAISGNSNVAIDPGIALTDAQSIYNENAIKQVLAWGAKEGIFLIHGATIGHPKGMPQNINNTVRCGTATDGSPVMQKIEYLGYSGLNASMQKKVTDITNAEIPKEVAGFSFIKGECNPCLPLSVVPDYSCPFKLNTGNGTEVTDVWKNLWGLGGSDANTEVKKNEFPVLSKLRSELNKAYSEFHFSEGEPSSNISTDDTTDSNAETDDNILSSDGTYEIGENLY